MLLLGSALAQQTPPATSQPSTTTKTQSSAKRPTTAARSATGLTLKTQKEKFSYAVGMRTGQRMAESFKKQSVPYDPAVLARGLKDGLAGRKPLLTEEEAQAAIKAVQDEVGKQQMEKMQEAAVANKKEGDAFLAANKGKEGVVTLPSGLQYKILKEGTGPKPTASDTVVCNYRGTLINGTEFDSSYKRGQPATFPVSGVIKGWTEALQLMPVGSKWQLFIPAGSCLWGSRRGCRYRPWQHTHLRSRTGFHPRKEQGGGSGAREDTRPKIVRVRFGKSNCKF